jgi:heme oxygenase
LKNQTASHHLEFENEHEALGAMYVIEGSTLGGNVIAKQLSKTEGFDEVTFNFSDVIRRIQDQCGRILRRFGY